MIVPLAEEHWSAVRTIYAAGIATGNATFETVPPTWLEWDRMHLGAHRFVSVLGSTVTGWAAAEQVSPRPVYDGVVESSVYVHPHFTRRGLGQALLHAIVASTETDGIWTIQAVIFPENAASLALHEKVGFRRLGVRERVGQHYGRWRDVVLLERRSPLID